MKPMFKLTLTTVCLQHYQCMAIKPLSYTILLCYMLRFLKWKWK